MQKQSNVVAVRFGKLKRGGAGYSFAGNYGTKGCYYYDSGKYKGRAYWGTGGKKSDYRKKPTGTGKYRVTFNNWDGSISCANFWLSNIRRARLSKVRRQGRCRN